jgi:uncharacterized protein YggE
MTTARLLRPVPRAAAVFLIALAIAGASACSRPAGSRLGAGAGAGADTTLVTVSAYAEARHAPDIAVLSTGVATLAPDANAAIRLNAERMTAVVKAIEAAGIARKDVQTSGVSLNPDYSYEEGKPPRIRGYTASNTVNVTVREIGRLGEILDALVATGANQVNGPSFDIEDKDAVLDEARGKALAKARVRAEGYAKRLGLRVGRVVSIDETGGRGAPVPMLRRSAMNEQAMAATASAPIAPGENVLGISLDVVYELRK